MSTERNKTELKSPKTPPKKKRLHVVLVYVHVCVSTDETYAKSSSLISDRSI